MERSLPAKLLVRPEHKVLVLGMPDDETALSDIISAGNRVDIKAEGTYDVIFLFAETAAALYERVSRLGKYSTAQTLIWVLYPLKASGIVTDLHRMDAWEPLGEYGLRVVASAGINDTWTAVRLRDKKQARPSGTSLAAIAGNDYGRFVDVTDRKVTMPDDMKAAVEANTGALTFFEQLSFSNKKEYVLWVLTARQDKTRESRIGQSVVKLAGGKKNPSVK